MNDMITNRCIQRAFIKVLPAVIALSMVPPLAAAEESSTKPNILFIMADDLGKEWISCYGAEDIETPNLDALAAGGIKLFIPGQVRPNLNDRAVFDSHIGFVGQVSCDNGAVFDHFGGHGVSPYLEGFLGRRADRCFAVEGHRPDVITETIEVTAVLDFDR